MLYKVIYYIRHIELYCDIGTCTGVVVNTGDHTIMGRIARLTGSIV